MLDWILAPAGITFDEYRKIGILSGVRLYRHYEKEGFETPSKKVELFSRQLEKWGLDPLPVYREPPETPFSDAELCKEYPLIAVNKKYACYKHSRDRQIVSLRKLHPEPVARINSRTARKTGIGDGDMVYIETKRGRIRQKVKLDNTIDPRVIEIDYGWYYPEKHTEPLMGWCVANMNVLTSNNPPFNREMGSSNLRGFACKVSKSEFVKAETIKSSTKINKSKKKEEVK